MSESNYHRRFGDRKEGRRLRTLPALNMFESYIMINRNDACNQFAGSVEISETDRWLRAKRQEGYKGLGMLHLFIAAYIRVVSQLPGLNRFVSGQRVYARNEILINMMVKRGITTESEETCAKVVFEPTDTIYDVYRKMNDAVEEIRVSDDSGTEKVAGVLMKIPARYGLFRPHPHVPAAGQPLPRLHDSHGPRLPRHPTHIPPSLQLRQPAGLPRLRRQAARGGA